MWVSTHFLFETFRLTIPNTRNPNPSCKVVGLFPSLSISNREKSLAHGTEWSQFTPHPPTWQNCFHDVVWHKPLFLRFSFAHNTHIRRQPFKHNLFRELRFWGTQLRRTTSLIFLLAAAACSGFPGNGQCSERGCLHEADNQLCGWRDKCFFEFGKKRLILSFDIPVSSFIDY